MTDRIVQLGALVAALAGYVALAIAGHATAEYLTLVTPVIAALYLREHLGKQDEVMARIDEQTNGVLTRRIKDAVQQALEERQGE